MSLAHPDGSKVPIPRITPLYGGRWRVELFKEIRNPSQLVDAAFPAFESVYPETPNARTTLFEDLRLIDCPVAPAERDGLQTLVYETLTGTFVDEIAPREDTQLNGLLRTRLTLIALPGTDTSDFVVGVQEYGPTQILAACEIDANDRYTRILAEYLEPGVVSTSERLVDGGLKEVTVRSFYDQNAPTPGILVSQTEENENGYPVWVSTVLQKSDGTSPTSGGAALTVSTQAEFTYPGRAKPFYTKRTFGSGPVYFFDVYMQPPAQATVEATTTVSYSTTASIGTLPYDRWNPTEWAVMRSSFVLSNDAARAEVKGLRGYRTETGATMEIDGTSTAFDPSWSSSFGWTIFGLDGSNDTLTAAEGPIFSVEGGPPNPGGNTYVIDFRVEPAFTSVAGTQYYRRTITYATIPAQAALPV